MSLKGLNMFFISFSFSFFLKILFIHLREESKRGSTGEEAQMEGEGQREREKQGA